MLCDFKQETLIEVPRADLQKHKFFDDFAELDIQQHHVFYKFVLVGGHPGL